MGGSLYAAQADRSVWCVVESKSCKHLEQGHGPQNERHAAANEAYKADVPKGELKI